MADKKVFIGISFDVPEGATEADFDELKALVDPFKDLPGGDIFFQVMTKEEMLARGKDKAQELLAA